MRLEERNTREAATALQQEPAMRLEDPKGEPNNPEPRERETSKKKGERETRGHVWRDGGDVERDRRVEQDKRTRDGAAGQESPAAGQESPAVPPPADGRTSATGAGSRVRAARLENANSQARNGEAAISLLQTGEWEGSAGGGSSGSSAVGGGGPYVLVCVCALAGAAVVLARRRR